MPAILVIAGIVAFREVGVVDGSEFTGGATTGAVTALLDYGWLAFLAAAIVTLIHRKTGAVLGLVAAVMCLPFYFYFILPSGVLDYISRYERKSPRSTVAIVMWLELLLMISVIVLSVLSVVQPGETAGKRAKSQ